MRKLLAKIRKILRDRRTRRFLTRFVSGVAAIVVFVTTYALVLPAITMEKEANCGIEAHQHDDSCYTGELICDIPESGGHHHDESCYSTTSTLICGMDEHEHSVENGCFDEDGNLICEKKEHRHKDECYEETRELTCQIPESEGHQHSDACYEKVLTCGKEIHIHSTACYENDPVSDSAVAASTSSAAAATTSAGSVSSAGMTLSFVDETVRTGGTDEQTPMDQPVDNDRAIDNDGFVDNDGLGETDGPSGSSEIGGLSETDRSSETASSGEGNTEVPMEMTYGGENAGTGSTEATNAALTNADNGATALTSLTESDQYIPPLEAVDFKTVLNDRTGIYYHHVADGETVEDSSAIPAEDWNRIPNNTEQMGNMDDVELGGNDLLRVYLSYTIPAGSLNATNPVARYRLPANLHLTDSQVKAINENVNGMTGQYVDMSALEITDPDMYNAYLGVEAVEGTRRPDETVEDYLAEQARKAGTDPDDAAEYISAVARVENVYDADGIYGEKDAYLGQDLIFTFAPYSIEKNRHEYDSKGQPTKAGKEIKGWLTLDLNMGQVDFGEAEITTSTVDVTEAEDVDGLIEDDLAEEGRNEDERNEDERTEDGHIDDDHSEDDRIEDEDASEGQTEDEHNANDNNAENSVEDNENNAAGESGEETENRQNKAVTIERAERTAEIVFVEEGWDQKDNKIDQISTRVTVVEKTVIQTQDNDTEENDTEENDAEAAAENPEEPGAGNTEKSAEGSTEESVADKDANQSDKGDTDQVIMPAMSFTDSIRVSTGKPAGIDEEAEGTLGSAVRSLPQEAEVSVRVEADEGTFPAGTTMVLKAVEDLDAVAEAVTETVENSDPSVSADGADHQSEQTEDSKNNNGTEEKKNLKTYGFQAVDITFLDKDGKEIQPAKPVRVALTSKIAEQVKEDAKTGAVEDPVVVHVDDDGNAEQMELLAPEEIEPAQGKTEGELLEEGRTSNGEQEETGTTDAAGEAPSVGFTADSFSVYVIVYTVDFHWEVDGKVYEFSIPGGGFVTLQQLVEVLGIADGDTYSENASDDEENSGNFSGDVDDYNAWEVTGVDDKGTYKESENVQDERKLTLADVQISEKTREFVSNVVNVEFSNPDLVWVGKINSSATVGEIKETQELEVQYSADLTEEHIDAINSSIVEFGDWALISMQPFSTEEVLLVTLKSGDQFTIKVTDAMYDITWSKPGETSTLLNFQEWVNLGPFSYYQTRQSIRVYYVDQNGDRIVKPSQVGSTTNINIDNWNSDAFDYSVSSDTVAKGIDGYTYLGAHADRCDGETVDRVRINRTDNYGYIYSTQLRNGNTDVNGSSIYLVYDGDGSASLDNTTTVHFGYLEGDSFVEFPESMKPSDDITATNEGLGWHHLIYDFYGTDDGKPFQYRYAGTYYSANGATDTPVTNGTQIQPLLRYYGNNWTYFTDMGYSNASITTNQNWKTLKDDSDIYVVYDKPVIPPGGSPTLKTDGQLPDVPNILKESVENGDGTNTLSLSVTGSREPMVAEKVADVIVILDLSTSMKRAIDSRDPYDNYQSNTNSRFYQAKQALQKLADNLYDRNDESGDPQYRLGLITFSNKAVVKKMPTENRQEFQSALNNITTHDTEEGTNWEHSLMVANQLDLPLDRATYIVFITDGGPTVRQTRLNLTDVQLDGYVENDKNYHGDIFHGGLNNGGFYDNTFGHLADRLHFRDYLGNGSFGGIMDEPVWNRRNRDAAVDEVKSIIDHNKGFFAIGVSQDAVSLESFVTASDQCDLSADHYELVSSESHFLNAIDKVLDDLNGMTGQADVRMTDGITNLTQTISKVNQKDNDRLHGVDGDFTYWKSNPPQVTWDEVKATWTYEQREGFTSGVSHAGIEGIPDGYEAWSIAKKAAYELGRQSVETSEQTAKNPADLWSEVWESWNKSLKDAYNAGVEFRASNETPEGYSGWSDEQQSAYAIGKKVTFSEWTTREADGCAAAVYNTETQAVEWNMGEKFMLEDGITYKVSFICWPSQKAYDIIAKLENKTITFGDTTVYDQEIWNQFEGDDTTGYKLKTNEEGANTKYRTATSISGNVTAGDEQDPLYFQHVPPMPLEKEAINVAKNWQASRIDTQDPEEVILQVVGDDELYKQFEIEPTEMVNGSTTNNYGSSEDIYISCGHLKVNKTTGAVVVYESGHDFTLREVGENSRHWDLDASVCRPMKINTVRTMLILVDDEDVPISMTSSIDYYASGNDEYYRIDGKVYKVDQAFADITGMNTRRSFLDLAKEVLVGGKVRTDPVNEKFTYKITINVDPTTLSWDPDLEKYVIISVVDANGTVSPTSILSDDTYQTTAKLPSACGFDASNDSKFLVAETGDEFFLSIKNSWSVRFLNLPVGTTYSIEEVLPADSDYEFNNLRLETRKDRTSVEPDSSNTYYVKTINGSISETSTLYKVVYQNEPKKGSLEITKNVTIDNGTIDPTGTDWAAGVYTFTITDANGRPAAGKVNGEWIEDGKVSITITNGASNTVTVTDVPIGEYTITEDTPDNGATLVAFSVNGTSKTVTNGVVAENDKKITIVKNQTQPAAASFTNNINTTKLKVRKVWADGTSGHDPIEYELYRSVYGIDDPANVINPEQKVDTTVFSDLGEKGFTGILGDANSWTETISKLPKAGTYALQGQDPVIVFYKYYVREKTHVSGYIYSLDGGQIPNESGITDNQLQDGDYIYVITNEKLSPTDHRTHIDIEKEWKDNEGNSEMEDIDLHKNDFITFKVIQKKYEAKVTLKDGTTRMLYPITVNLDDKNANNQGSRVSHKTIVYVPKGASFTIEPNYLGSTTSPTYSQHTVEAIGISVDPETSYTTQTYNDPNRIYYYTGVKFTINEVNEAMEVKISLHDGNDVWRSLTVSGETVELINNPGSNDDNHSWTCVMSSREEIIWELNEMFTQVLSGNAYDTPGSDTPIPVVTPFEYTMRLSDNTSGLPTQFQGIGNAPGEVEGDNDELWKGRIDELLDYKYRETDTDPNGISYIYTYEVEEAAIGSNTVAGSDSVNPLVTPQNPSGTWNGQTTSYLVKWDKDASTGVWTMTNQKKPPIDISIYKVDKDNIPNDNTIPDNSSRLKGALFKLVKRKLEKMNDGDSPRWEWVTDSSWGTNGESAVVSDSSQNPGVFSFAELDAGYYEIVEMQYPAGYIQANENPIFEVKYNKDSIEPEIVLVYASGSNIGQPITGNVSEQVKIGQVMTSQDGETINWNENGTYDGTINAAVTVGNTPGAALPNTGGSGTTALYLLGFMLTAFAGAGLVMRKRRKAA